MPLIARLGMPQPGERIEARIDTPTKIGNAISIFFGGKRVALGRVEEDLSKDPKYTREKYVDPRRITPVSPAVNTAKNTWGIRVEKIFGDDE